MAEVVREGRDVTLISTGTADGASRGRGGASWPQAASTPTSSTCPPSSRSTWPRSWLPPSARVGSITVEEHTVIGGLGGAVAETLSEHRPTRVDRIGIADHYTESASNEELLDMYGLSAERVAQRVRGMLANETRVTG